MNIRKFFIIFAIATMLVVMLAFTANAELITVNDAFVESITVTEGNSRAEQANYMFDGDKTTGGVYNDRYNVWFGNVGDVLTVTFRGEIDVRLVAVYITGNWCQASVSAFNEAGDMVISGVTVTGENNIADKDGEYRNVFNDAIEGGDQVPDDPNASVKIKTLTVTVLNYKWSQPRTLQISEIFILTEHEHDYSKLDHIVQSPTCSAEGTGEYICVCGGKENNPVPPTGEHTEAEFIAFRNGYTEAGALVIGCPTCNTQDIPITEIGALFTPLGYSVSETGAYGIQYGYAVNYDNIATFTELAGYGLEFGIVTFSTKAFTGENPLLMSPEGIQAAESTVICKNMTGSGYSIINYKISGLSEANKDHQFVLAGYVTDGVEISYIGDFTTFEYIPVSYSSVLANAAN